LYASFYQTQVAGQTGRWGTILPNGLTAGVRRIETRDGTSAAALATLIAPDGLRGTRALAGGMSAVGIHVPAPGATGFAQWQARHFLLSELAPGGIGHANGSPAGDGVANLLKYGFAMNPFSPDRSGLPTCSLVNDGGEKRLRFQFRRLTGEHGLNYRLRVSNNLAFWSDAEPLLLPGEQTTPSEMPGAETVIRYLPVQPGTRSLRLEVETR
jgi:hypothetical protein